MTDKAQEFICIVCAKTLLGGGGILFAEYGGYACSYHTAREISLAASLSSSFNELVVDVRGVIPAPKGSLRPLNMKGRTILIEDNKKTKPFRKEVAKAVFAQANSTGWITESKGEEIPLYIDAIFYMPKPKTVKRKFPCTKPDLDKLVRTLCDAIQDAEVIADDSRFIISNARKFYANTPEEVGVYFKIRKISGA